MREACSAGARGARGRSGGPWAEASPGVPAAAPRGHVRRAPRRGGRGRGCQRSAGGPRRRGPTVCAVLPGRLRPGPSASSARSARGCDLADRAGLLPPPPLRAMDGGNSARRRSRRRQPPPALQRGRPPLASSSVREALAPPDAQPGRCPPRSKSGPAGWRPRVSPAPALNLDFSRAPLSPHPGIFLSITHLRPQSQPPSLSTKPSLTRAVQPAPPMLLGLSLTRGLGQRWPCFTLHFVHRSRAAETRLPLTP